MTVKAVHMVLIAGSKAPSSKLSWTIPGGGGDEGKVRLRLEWESSRVRLGVE